MTALVFGTLILLWIKKPKSPGEDFPTSIVVLVSITVLILIVVLLLLTQVFLTASNGFEIFIFTWSLFNSTTIFPYFLVDSMSNLKQHFRDTLNKMKCKVNSMFCSASVGVINVNV